MHTVGVLAPDALRRLRYYADQLEQRAPGVASGVYAVGSVALGDYRAALSNLDVLVLSERPWRPEQVAACRRAARVLDRRRQPATVAYLTWSQLGSDPAGVEAPCFRGRRPVPATELVNPLTWSVMRSSGVSLRGPEYPDLGPGELRSWAGDRLEVTWARKVDRERRRAGSLWFRRSTTEQVLEVARLSQAVGSGRVVSKLEAGELAAAGAPPRFERILKDASGFRRGARMSMYWGPFERKRDALDYMAAVCEGVVA